MQTIVALFLLAASPDAVPPPASAETPAAKPVKPKKICRAGSATGTRMSNKICKTQAEWDAQLGADSTKLNKNSGSGY